MGEETLHCGFNLSEYLIEIVLRYLGSSCGIGLVDSVQRFLDPCKLQLVILLRAREVLQSGVDLRLEGGDEFCFLREDV